jgi:hypothetical protein
MVALLWCYVSINKLFPNKNHCKFPILTFLPKKNEMEGVRSKGPNEKGPNGKEGRIIQKKLIFSNIGVLC